MRNNIPIFTLLLIFVLFGQLLFAQTFTEIPLPVSQPQPFDGVSESSIAFADVDGDGDDDVLITGAKGSSAPYQTTAKLYINDGTGYFIEAIGTPFDGVWDASIAFSDVDGDGDQDVLITGNSVGNLPAAPIAKLYINDGNGIFTVAVGTPFEGVYRGSIAFSDVDSDGDEDVLITGNNSSSFPSAKLYTNDGTGGFTEVAGTPFKDVVTSSIAFSDVDGDGDDDVLITGLYLGRIAVLYTNNGTGTFTEVTGTPFEGVMQGAVAFSDIDGDGDEDVLITGYDNSSMANTKLYTNDGMGAFTQVMNTPFEQVYDSSIAFSDVDGDGDEDVLITGLNGSADLVAKLYTNDGMGVFTEVMGTTFNGVYFGSVAFSDVDGDGDEDALLTGSNNFVGKLAKLYTNDGTGAFAEATEKPFVGAFWSSVAFADVDSDGDEDVLIAGRTNTSTFKATSKLYINDGAGIYTQTVGAPFEGVWDGSIAFSDVDGDGDEDVLITGSNSASQRIAKLYTNDGMGAFTAVTGTPFEPVDASSVAFADVDGDGDNDVLVTGLNSSFDRTAKLYTNNGVGVFTEVAGASFIGVWDGSIAFADVNGDGDEDVLITGRDGSDQRIAKLYTNDGMGNFTEVTGTPFDGATSGSIAFADVDGDNDQDVLITGGNPADQRIAKLYTNDGMGNFTEDAGTPFEGVATGSSVAFADFDGDNDQDVFISGSAFLGFSSRLYTNNGSGTFTEVAGTPFDRLAFCSVAFSDVDDDGDKDVLITGQNSSLEIISKLYRTDGTVSVFEIFSANPTLSFEVFPNPTSGFFQISGATPDVVRVVDQQGKLVRTVNNGRQQVDLGDLPAGVYFLEVREKGQWATQKIIKE